MPSETTEAVRQSSSHLWLIAGIPALLVIVYLIYSAVSQANTARSSSAPAPGDSSLPESEDQ